MWYWNLLELPRTVPSVHEVVHGAVTDMLQYDDTGYWSASLSVSEIIFIHIVETIGFDRYWSLPELPSTSTN